MVQDSRSASYPGAAIASSYDFGSIDFFLLCPCHFISTLNSPDSDFFTLIYVACRMFVRGYLDLGM